MFKKIGAQVAQATLLASAWSSIAWAQVPKSLRDGAGDAKPDGAATEINVVFKNVANTLIFIVGAVAVIMLIVGGLRYVLSGGNKEAVEGAKNTILYAIIGIIVAILAFAAVQFVIGQFSG